MAAIQRLGAWARAIAVRLGDWLCETAPDDPGHPIGCECDGCRRADDDDRRAW